MMLERARKRAGMPHGPPSMIPPGWDGVETVERLKDVCLNHA